MDTPGQSPGAKAASAVSGGIIVTSGPLTSADKSDDHRIKRCPRTVIVVLVVDGLLKSWPVTARQRLVFASKIWPLLSSVPVARGAMSEAARL